MACVELLTTISAPRQRCFDLARSVDVHVRSTSATEESVIAGRTAGLLALDEEVTWRARHFGMPLTLTSRITAFDPPNHFRDSMVRGPLARLAHDHYFTEDGPAGAQNAGATGGGATGGDATDPDECGGANASEMSCAGAGQGSERDLERYAGLRTACSSAPTVNRNGTPVRVCARIR